MSKIIFTALFCFSVVLLGGRGLFAQGLQHEHHQMQEANKLNYGLCPVAGTEAYKEYSHIYKDKIYYFCCETCIHQFMQEPEKYLAKIKEIKLEAYQYGFSPDPMVIKKGDIVKLQMTSRDVPHGVYIKEYGINVTVKKDETKRIEFLANREGKFDILCSVYCGTGHSRMKGVLIVEPDETLRR